MDISYMYHPIHIRHFGSREKVRASALCLRIIFSDYRRMEVLKIDVETYLMHH